MVRATVVIVTTTLRFAAACARLTQRARDTWVRRRRELCVALCWHLLLVHFGLPCLLLRTTLLARRAWRAGDRPWWGRLGLDDVAEMALDALGLPSDFVRFAVLAAGWLRRRYGAWRD